MLSLREINAKLTPVYMKFTTISLPIKTIKNKDIKINFENSNN